MNLLIDTTNIAYRANSILDLSNDGGNVSAVYGTLLSLRHVIKKFGPCRVICCWDSGTSWRSKVYPQYKAHRRTADNQENREDVYRQIKVLKQLLYTLGVTQIQKAGLEADDLIALCCRSLEGSKVIVSGDRDFVQLITEDVSLYYLHKKTLIDKSNCKRYMGFPPVAYLHKKILEGDKSDNISGVPGVADKTAAEIINRLHTSDPAILHQNLHKLPNRIHKLLDKDDVEDIIRRNRKLMDLRRLKGEIPARLLRAPKPSFAAFRGQLIKHGFVSLLKDLRGWTEIFTSCGIGGTVL